MPVHQAIKGWCACVPRSILMGPYATASPSIVTVSLASLGWIDPAQQAALEDLRRRFGGLAITTIVSADIAAWVADVPRMTAISPKADLPA